MRVIFSADSKRDLAEIGAYIAGDSPGRALTFVRELRVLCVSLSDSPLRFPVVRKIGAFAMRRGILGNYLIFHAVRTDGIFIVRILHAARDYERLLFPDD
jgi:toxin ParE1/3/4